MIADRVKDQTIDGYTYRVTPLGSKIGQQYLLRLLKLAGPALMQMASKGKSLQESGAAALSTLLLNLEQKDLDDFENVFGDATLVCEQGKEASGPWVPLNADTRDHHFSARYMQWVDWLIFCAEVNFNGFFIESMKRANGAAAKKATTPTIA